MDQCLFKPYNYPSSTEQSSIYLLSIFTQQFKFATKACINPVTIWYTKIKVINRVKDFARVIGQWYISYHLVAFYDSPCIEIKFNTSCDKVCNCSSLLCTFHWYLNVLINFTLVTINYLELMFLSTLNTTNKQCIHYIYRYTHSYAYVY